MTPTEKPKSAEQIAQYIGDNYILDKEARISAIVEIREALTAYAEERVKVARECEADEREATWCHQCCLEAQEKARAEAFEECRKLCKCGGLDAIK